MARRNAAWDVVLFGWLGFWLSFGLLHFLPLPIVVLPIAGCWAALFAVALWLRSRTPKGADRHHDGDPRG